MAVILKKCLKDVYTNTEGIWCKKWYRDDYRTTGLAEAAIMTGAIMIPIAIVVIGININCVLKWLVVPEIQYLAMLQGYV